MCHPEHCLFLAPPGYLQGLREQFRPSIAFVGIGVSLQFRKYFAVQQVLMAGTWKFPFTFTSFYLRDITHKSMDTFSIGPVVAAQ